MRAAPAMKESRVPASLEGHSPTSFFHAVTNDNDTLSNPKVNAVVEEWRWKREEEPAFHISHPFRNPDLGRKESNVIRTACLNFGREHSHILRVCRQSV